MVHQFFGILEDVDPGAPLSDSNPVDIVVNTMDIFDFNSITSDRFGKVSKLHFKLIIIGCRHSLYN